MFAKNHSARLFCALLFIYLFTNIKVDFQLCRISVLRKGAICKNWPDATHVTLIVTSNQKEAAYHQCSH